MNVPGPPTAICREIRVLSDFTPLKHLIGAGQGVPGPQMPKVTCPNSPICCHASVHVGERGAWTCLEPRKGGFQQSSAPESAVMGTAQAGREEGRGGQG